MEKVVLCYRCKTRHMLGMNCPVATPTPEDSGMSFSEQNGTPPRDADGKISFADGKISFGEVLIRIRTQSHALILTHKVSLALDW